MWSKIKEDEIKTTNKVISWLQFSKICWLSWFGWFLFFCLNGRALIQIILLNMMCMTSCWRRQKFREILIKLIVSSSDFDDVCDVLLTQTRNSEISTKFTLSIGYQKCFIVLSFERSHLHYWPFLLLYLVILENSYTFLGHSLKGITSNPQIMPHVCTFLHFPNPFVCNILCLSSLRTCALSVFFVRVCVPNVREEKGMVVHRMIVLKEKIDIH